MLEIGAMDLGLLLSESEVAGEMALALISAPKIARFINRSPKQGAALRQRIARWGEQLGDEIRHKPVPPALEREYLAYQECRAMALGTLVTRLPALQLELERGSAFAGEAHALIRQLLEQPTDSRRRLLLERWRASLVGELLTLQQAIAEAEREKLRCEIEDQLLANRTLADALDPHQVSAGGLWDLAQGHWHRRSLELVKQYARLLEKEPLLREIANLLGRSQHAKEREQSPLPPQEVRELQPVQSDEVPDDLVGLHPAGDLLRMLPSEAAMLGDADLEFEFYRRYLERRLLSYQSRGTLPRHAVVLQTPRQGGEQEQRRGPFIVCIDTSGSMGGYPEECAKALFLALLGLAMEERRPCYLMLFSTEVATLEITAETGLEQAERFLSMSFHGGTDLVPCLERALTQLDVPEFRRADVLIISDFIAQNLPHALLARMDAQRRLQTRFHAVALSRHAKRALLRVFDRSWLLDCGLRGRLLRRWLH
ncbi:ATPase RavA stimulator ViaA [Aeromonas simiae]|uniref:ATPase RavA stimulator ViaA n=1 Tax=Aeromonas simiae TaxID=218936 RepID=A0A5J6WTS8_9GAMM|nr:ATPase RavA stimulator ViaA [Aeromonas simiae]QFI53581.1 ATPase RavA stimulator ViaA [Aeromonas simiae]